MPKHPFFVSALSAAKVNVETFEAEFKKSTADANIQEYGTIGISLIYRLISSIADTALPPLLAILCKNNVDINHINEDEKYPPFAYAAYLGKLNTVNFLIANKAFVQAANDRALYAAADGLGNYPAQCLEVIKTLVEQHHANLNVRGTYNLTPLMMAVQHGSLEAIHYLLAKGADPSLEMVIKEKNALKFAFEALDTSCTNRKACLDVMIRATYEQVFYKQAVRLAGTIEEIQMAFYNNLTISGGATNIDVKQLVIDKALIPALERLSLEREQRNTFFMGSRLTQKQQQKHDSVPAIYQSYFRHQLFDPNTIKKIFSYLYQLPRKVTQIKSETELKSSTSSALLKK